MSNKILRAILLIIVLTSLLPQGQPARAAPLLPPVDMFQLPWELGKAWVAYDGFGRHATSAHNSANGGAVDFAPHPNMKKGEDTSNAWVTAAAAGTVVKISSCHLILAHANGWLTEYQHLANFQVKLGSVVERNQKLAVIANASASQPVCLGSVETDIPHLHFALRPNMVGATFAGWEFRYNSLFNITTFVKDGNSVGLFKPLLNVMGTSTTPTSTPTTGTPASTPTMTPPSGPYVSTTVDTTTIPVGGITLVTVRLNNVPTQGYNSGEFACTYNASILETSNITIASLFGTDSASAINGPQNGQFIVAIAGSKGNKATTSGIVFTFTVKGLTAGLSSIQCGARVSQGTSVLTDLPSVGTSVTVTSVNNNSTSTSTPTASVAPSATMTSTISVSSNRVSSLTFTSVASGLSQPVFVTHAEDGSGRLFVLERAGRIRVINSAGVLLQTPFLDISSIVRSVESEEGILGLVFHPAYESNGLFFVTYNTLSGDLTLARYSVSADPNVANPASAANVLTILHPVNSNHNGGMIAFGDDGYLYWSVGDGGGGGDTSNNAQNINVLLGKILRLDVNSASPYGIPPNNPFVGTPGARGEIWDFGFRNPWRFSFDRGTGDLYIGDVGQGAREEISYEPSASAGGLNYGWRVMEGSLCFNPSIGCDTSGKVLPVAEYDNTATTCAVTGGYVYRGSASPQMAGTYLYGDFCSGEIWGLEPGLWTSTLILDTAFLISSFGEDEAGELYLTDYSSGSVQKIIGPNSPLLTPTFTPTPAGSPSLTPTFTSIPAESPTPTASAIPNQTFTPLPQPTATTSSGAAITGQVIASKVVTVRLYDLNDTFVASVNANSDGTFRLDVAAGTYTIVATANGFLRVQGTVTLSGGEIHAMHVITLLAGDIDDDGSIDQFDALTIGFGYGTSHPPGADLNNDGIINVLDLERLAKNYRKTGPVPWE